MPKTITIKKLSISEFEKARRQIERYKRTIELRNIDFIKALADVGIDVAEQNMGKYQGYVKFSSRRQGNEITIYAEDITTITRVWRGGSTDQVSPIMMAEFGSGWKAEVLVEENPGAGQGTFPGQKHANNPMGWTWKDDNPTDENGMGGIRTGNGYVHTSYGETPTHPIHNAMMEMLEQIGTIARSVFGGS